MVQPVTFRLQPALSQNREAQIRAVVQALKCDPDDITGIRILRRSLDARGKSPVVVLQAEVFFDEPAPGLFAPIVFNQVTGKKSAVIVGAGPAGLFAALELIRHNIRPIVLERGKDVTTRRFDLKTINRKGICNPDSNYCFGEGGAGTYSDGKLYTRATKRGNVRDILSLLVQHGAALDILMDAHPHIGSNRLPKIIAAIRRTILSCGGEIHFNTRVTGLILTEKQIRGVTTRTREFATSAVILATGHSARDIYFLLDDMGIRLAAKPYAMGVRVEHPQALINAIQYGRHAGNPLLPAASYTLSGQFGRAGVYSFCMCPGGMLVPAVESRTSSPVRIPRDPATRMHPDVEGLYPAGEGAGYSGGIISSALDGQITARAVAARITNTGNGAPRQVTQTDR